MNKTSIEKLLTLSVYLLLCTHLTADADTPQFQQHAPLKILCLGDSITAGIGAQTQGGYRGPLQNLLTQANINFDFLGRYSTPSITDPNHEGDSGARLVYLLKQNKAITLNALNANPNPDIIILLIGINDLIENRNSPQTTIKRMDSIPDEINLYEPNAKIILANLIPNAADDPVKTPQRYQPENSYINSEDKVIIFNNLLSELINSKKYQHRNIALLDLHSHLTKYDLFDGIHPNKTGYNKMAALFYNHIANAADEINLNKPQTPLQKISKHVVDTFTGPNFDLPNWVISGDETDSFNKKGQFTIASPYRGLRRIVSNGSFEAIFELKNIDLKPKNSSINLGFVPRDPASKVMLIINENQISILFRDLEAASPINQKFNGQVKFKSTPTSLKIKFTWNHTTKRWRIFYGINGQSPATQLPQSKAGLFFTKPLEQTAEALVSTRNTTLDVDHFEFGPSVKGSQYYKNNPPSQTKTATPQTYFGNYYKCSIPPSIKTAFPGSEFEIWIPKNTATLKGIIVRQHGAGASGKSFAHDLQFQALAKKHDFALIGTFHKATQNFRQWTNPKNGSGPAFLKALDYFAKKSNHPELNSLQWIIWGHSAGGHWANYMARQYPNRVSILVTRSGHGIEYTGYDLKIPNLQMLGQKEADPLKKWYTKLATTGNLRVIATEPNVGHACSNSRFLAVAFIEAVLLELKKNNNKPLKRQNGWLGDINSLYIAPYCSFEKNKDNAYWLVNENFAKKWKLFIQTGQITDQTPPPSPKNVTMQKTKNSHTIIWNALADIESATKKFNIYRNNKIIAALPAQSWNRGDEPDPVDCKMKYTIDTTDSTDQNTINSTFAVSAVNYNNIESELAEAKFVKYSK